MTFNYGDIITVDFPGITGTKRRPAVILSSTTYHSLRPDVIMGLITTQTKNLGKTDYALQDWETAGLRVPSIFRSFIVTLPRSANLIWIGKVTERDWQGIKECIKSSLADLTT